MTKETSWTTFFISLVIGVLIFIGIYTLTGKLLSSIFLGLGIYGVVYFICVGLVLTANHLADIKKILKEE